MQTVRRSFVLLVAFVSITAAKEPTRKLIIWGDGLAGSIEITDSATLALANVYAENFLDTSKPTAPAPVGLPRYEISFYLTDGNRGLMRRIISGPRLRRAYVVYFTPDEARHQNYVYLPGAGDTWASWNHSVIIRDDRDGRWSYASAAFGQRIANAIAHARRRPAPACPLRDSTGMIRPADSVYNEVRALTTVLSAHGIHVLCAYQSTFDGMLGQPGVGVATTLGSFAALLFPSPAGAAAVTMTSTVVDGQLLTVLRGPNPRRPVDSLYGADKADFVIYKRWLFDPFGQLPLRTALAAAVER